MTPRDWSCWQCGSRFVTDAQGELVEYTSTAHWCRGCQRLLAILQESALWREKARLLEKPRLAPVVTVAQMAARGQAKRILPFDARKAAANDREDED